MPASVDSSSSSSRFDPTYTKSVIDGIGPNANPRLKKLLSGLIQHLHDFCRENDFTMDEFMQAIDYINQAGLMSKQRNELQLLCDVIGIETLVDEITHTVSDDAGNTSTATSMLGPFWRKDAPKRDLGESIVMNDIPEGDHTLVYGQVTDFSTGEPIEGAELDIWETAPNGLYEQQDPNQPDMNLRGRFYTGTDGKYHLYCLRPTSYPIPTDGLVGDLVKLMDKPPMRPAHIHFAISAKDYKPLITQVFDRQDKYIDKDVAFSVKENLTVDFIPRQGDPKAQFEVKFDFKLVSHSDARKHGVPLDVEQRSVVV